MNYVFEINLPEHVRFLSLYAMFDGRWSLGVAARYELLSPAGSSLGGVVATGYGLSIGEAQVNALAKLQERIEEANNRPRVPLPPAPSKSVPSARNTSAFGEKSVDDILGLIMGGKK
jgi:hypothetical protein